LIQQASPKICTEALRTEFKNLTDEEKLKYVTKALKEQDEYAV